MRFLPDERCDFTIVRALRAPGHDVRSVQEERAAIADDEVVAWAVNDERIVVAEDKDFGYLVHVARAKAVGGVLLRYPTSARREMPSRVLAAVQGLGDRLRGVFVVVQPGKVRLTPGRGRDGRRVPPAAALPGGAASACPGPPLRGDPGTAATSAALRLPAVSRRPTSERAGR